MYRIKFSGDYIKHKQFDKTKPFILMDALKLHLNDLSQTFKDWDTLYTNKDKFNLQKYMKEKDEIILLILQQDNKLTTTIRRFNPSKYKFYKDQIGKVIMIEVIS